MKQEENENSVEVMKKIIEAYEQLETTPQESVQIEYILDGLKEEIRKSVIYHRDTKLEDLRERLETWG